MGRYAEKTMVSSERSRNEIESTLTRYGATGFAYGWQGTVAIIGFQMLNRSIKFSLPMPDKGSKEFWTTPSGRRRNDSVAAEIAWEQATRQRWRALALAVKAKLEAVASQITTFEEEFMAHIVLPNGKTAGQYFLPQVEQGYKDKKMPPLLGFSE